MPLSSPRQARKEGTLYCFSPGSSARGTWIGSWIEIRNDDDRMLEVKIKEAVLTNSSFNMDDGRNATSDFYGFAGSKWKQTRQFANLAWLGGLNRQASKEGVTDWRTCLCLSVFFSLSYECTNKNVWFAPKICRLSISSMYECKRLKGVLIMIKTNGLTDLTAWCMRAKNPRLCLLPPN